MDVSLTLPEFEIMSWTAPLAAPERASTVEGVKTWLNGVGQSARDGAEVVVEAGKGALLGAVAMPIATAYGAARLVPEKPRLAGALGFMAGLGYFTVSGGYLNPVNTVLGAAIGAAAGASTDMNGGVARATRELAHSLDQLRPDPEPRPTITGR